jgi:pyridoxine kinase
LSGYVGDAAVVNAIAEAVTAIKAANPRALFCCDPVMGNERRELFVPAPVAQAIGEELVPLADIATPNRFELAHLTGRDADTPAAALDAADALAATGPGIVVCTSLPMADGIGVLARAEAGAWLVRTPRLEVAANGAGDVFAAILFARLLAGADLARALILAVSAVFAVLEATRAAGAQELALIAAQDRIADPDRLFGAERLR